MADTPVATIAPWEVGKCAQSLYCIAPSPTPSQIVDVDGGANNRLERDAGSATLKGHDSRVECRIRTSYYNILERIPLTPNDARYYAE